MPCQLVVTSNSFNSWVTVSGSADVRPDHTCIQNCEVLPQNWLILVAYNGNIRNFFCIKFNFIFALQNTCWFKGTKQKMLRGVTSDVQRKQKQHHRERLWLSACLSRLAHKNAAMNFAGLKVGVHSRQNWSLCLLCVLCSLLHVCFIVSVTGPASTFLQESWVDTNSRLFHKYNS